MATPKEDLPKDDVSLPKINDKQTPEDETIVSFTNATEVLMPELDELVKKNPNRLIGCGG